MNELLCPCNMKVQMRWFEGGKINFDNGKIYCIRCANDEEYYFIYTFTIN